MNRESSSAIRLAPEVKHAVEAYMKLCLSRRDFVLSDTTNGLGFEIIPLFIHSISMVLLILLKLWLCIDMCPIFNHMCTIFFSTR